MLDTIVVEKEVYEARKKAKNILVSTLLGEEDNEFSSLPGNVGDDGSYDRDQIDDPMGHGRKYLGEAQVPTVPLEDAPNPFPMLEEPLG